MFRFNHHWKLNGLSEVRRRHSTVSSLASVDLGARHTFLPSPRFATLSLDLLMVSASKADFWKVFAQFLCPTAIDRRTLFSPPSSRKALCNFFFRARFFFSCCCCRNSRKKSQLECRAGEFFNRLIEFGRLWSRFTRERWKLMKMIVTAVKDFLRRRIFFESEETFSFN